MEMIWPIALVVAANIAYQLCAKAVPKEMDALTVTYLVGAACSAALFFFTHRGGSLLQEYAKMNAAPVLLGMSVVGLEVGFIYAYKAGWPVSTASIVQSAFLAVALIFLGTLIYREAVTVNKLAGVAICLVGLWFLSR